MSIRELTAARTAERLPGEDGPLEMRHGGAPITPDEALGVARRWARVARGQGRRLRNLDLPNELPLPDATLVPAAYRLPPRQLMFVRAKAEMEGRTVTDIVTEALQGYAESAPGARVQYKAPRPTR